MDSLLVNKIAGSVILTLLAVWVIGMIGDALVKPAAHGPSHMQVAEAPKTGAVPKEEEQDPPIATLLASANPAEGEKIFKKCQSCHTIDDGGANKVGPNLHNIVGRDRGSHEGFSYSKAMTEAEGDWSYQHLYEYLKNPRATVPGTKMVFAGLKKPGDRADLIAYLRAQTASPPPLPAQ